MLTHPKILLGDDFEKIPKMGFGNVADMYSKSHKNQTKCDRDLKYGSK